jgi:glucan 1,3-beta-glucosidase
VYSARGILFESHGPSHIQSVSNEHSQLYNWQFVNAKALYAGHIQSESAYYEAGQHLATGPYKPNALPTVFAEDPVFVNCNKQQKDPNSLDICRVTWALRVLNSSDLYFYDMGFYSFFQNYQDKCSAKHGVCQSRMVETDFSSKFIHMYNLFTVGTNESVTAEG